MKKIIFPLLLMLFAQGITAQKSSKLIASCCESKEARCTGSASCRACTNCSRCGYCNSGGSCGVCSARTTYVSSKKVARTTKTYRSANSTMAKNYSTGDLMMVTNQTLNLRSGPGTDYDILETLEKNDMLGFISKSGDWAKVEVVATGTIGYVHLNYVK